MAPGRCDYDFLTCKLRFVNPFYDTALRYKPQNIFGEKSTWIRWWLGVSRQQSKTWVIIKADRCRHMVHSALVISISSINVSFCKTESVYYIVLTIHFMEPYANPIYNYYIHECIITCINVRTVFIVVNWSFASSITVDVAYYLAKLNGILLSWWRHLPFLMGIDWWPLDSPRKRH